MTDINPHISAANKSDDAIKYSFMQRGRVTSAVQTGEKGAHHVVLQETADTTDAPIPVLPTVHGDFYIPPEGAPVAVLAGEDNQQYAIAAPVPAIKTPNIEPGERIISHPLSKASVEFNADGSIDVHGDTEVRINGGDQGIITDINTTTDADGHITDISLVRDSNIKI